MKSKIYQAMILLSIIVIEIVGFNNQWKYDFLGLINANFQSFFAENLVWFKLIAILLIVASITFLWLKLWKKKNEPLFIVYLIKGFQVKGSDMLGVFNVVFTLCSIAWIGIEIYYNTISGFMNAVIYSGFMILYPLLLANYFLHDETKMTNYHPKVLITALSIVQEKFLRQSLDEMKVEPFKSQWLEQTFYNSDGTVKKAGPGLWGPWGNLDPIRKSIIEHKAMFHEIILISSFEATEACNLLPQELKPQQIISDFLNLYYPIHKIKIRIVSDDISGNDMILNGVGIKNIINSLSSRGFFDKDILFNVTGSTVAVSGAMILQAIPSGRRAEYARQDTGKIEEIPLSIYEVKDLWNELLEKVG